ncbi:MAG: tRNA lysidine(34) synthetase TilS [Planctomycetota bacterium]|jgi:tRNA(Ile)-lysidine synthase
MGLVDRAREAARRHAMLPEAGAVVVAVSGGPDSMTLIECLWRVLEEREAGSAAARLVVAHLHHGLRAGADADAEFVRGQAEERGCRFVLGREDVGAIARAEGLSTEAAARKARYAFLMRCATDAGAPVIALGHNADDQAETVLLRLLRGAGVRGVGGMRPVRSAGPEVPGVRIVRPLLEVARAEIEAFVSEEGIPYRTDETNADRRFTRNRVRLDIVPALREGIQPRLAEVVGRFARLAREASDHLDAEAARALGDMGDAGEAAPGERFAFPREAWEALAPALLGPALRLAFESVSGRALTNAHVEAVRAVAASPEGGEAGLPGGWRAVASAGGIALVPPGDEGPEPVAPWSVDLAVPGSAELPDGRVLTATVRPLGAGERPPRETDPSLATEWADYDALRRPARLVLRSRRAGDEFRPLGAGGSRTVKRFLIDIKLPRAERERVPVVATPAGRIVWLAPIRLDERARVTAATREVLELALRLPSDGCR